MKLLVSLLLVGVVAAAEDKQPQKRGVIGAGLYGAPVAPVAPVAPLYSHGGLGLYNHAPLSAGLYGHGLYGGGLYGGGLYGGSLYGGGLYGGGPYGGGLYGGGLYGAPLARHVAPLGFGGAPWLGHGGYLH